MNINPEIAAVMASRDPLVQAMVDAVLLDKFGTWEKFNDWYMHERTDEKETDQSRTEGV